MCGAVDTGSPTAMAGVFVSSICSTYDKEEFQ